MVSVPNLTTNKERGVIQLSLNISLLMTFIILLIPFAIYFKSSNRKGKLQYVIACLVYLVMASPVVYGVIDHKIVQYEDANIGLGLSFFITWFLTVCLFVASLVVFFRNRGNKE